MKHLAILAALLATPSLASAHGGDPLPRDLHDAGDGSWVLSTNFGLISSEQRTHYVCEEAFLGGDNFLVAPMGARAWVTFSESRIMRTEDGCYFSEVMRLEKTPTALASDPVSGLIVFLTNEEGLPTMHVSRDRGASFQGVELSIASEVHWTGVELLGGDLAYLSAYSREDEDKGSALLFTASLSTGALTPHEGLAGTKYPYLFDADGERMAGLTNTEEGIALFWGTPDEVSGSFRQLESWPTDMDATDGGATLYLSSATADGGLLIGTWADDGPVFESASEDHSARCVTRLDEDLYLCARRDREGHDLTRLGEDGVAYAALDFKTLEGPPPECPADSQVAKTCAVVWPELAKALRLEIDPPNRSDEDMGSGMEPDLEMGQSAPEEMEQDASMMSGEGDGQDTTPRRTCSSVETEGAPGNGWGAVLGVLCLWGWRRRKEGQTL